MGGHEGCGGNWERPLEVQFYIDMIFGNCHAVDRVIDSKICIKMHKFHMRNEDLMRQEGNVYEAKNNIFNCFYFIVECEHMKKK